MKLVASLLCLSILLQSTLSYDLVKDYSGLSFFDDWDFYGSWDNLTLGDVWWLDQDDAYAQDLAYVNEAGNAVMKVDNSTNVPYNQKRNSIRITTQDSYALGSLWIVDLVHIPYGCSVWPAFWTLGPTWPNDGEIDIIEGINTFTNNQMAVHTTSGCTHTTPPDQTGNSPQGTTASDCSTGAGCVVQETKPNSFGAGFAAAGGGVWATQFDVSGIYIWYWSRPDIPQTIQQSTSTSSIDMSDWGAPSGAYLPTTCDIAQFFTPQQLVFDITLCGDWAGVPAIYGPTCGNSGPTGLCYNDCVVGPGSPRYDSAYFEVSYVRAYTVLAATSTSASASISPTSSNNDDSNSGAATAPAVVTNPSVAPSNQDNANAAAKQAVPLCLLVLSMTIVSGITLLHGYW